MKIICILPQSTKKSTAPWLRMKAFQLYFESKAKHVEFICPEENLGLFRAQQKSAKQLFTLIKKLRLSDPQEKIIIFHRSSFFLLYLYVARMWYDCHIIQDFHGYYFVEKKIRKQYLRTAICYIPEKMTALISHHIISVSQAVSHQLGKQAQAKGTIIPNGIITEDMDDAVKTPLSHQLQNHVQTPAKVKIGFVGNVGIWFDMAFVRDALDQVDGVVLHLIGDGVGLNDLKEHSRIIRYGRLSHNDAMAVMAHMDAFITPYTSQFAFAQVPGHFAVKKNREYIYFGKPLIVGDIPGKDDLLQESEGVYWYNPDEQESLVQVLQLLIEDKKRYQEKISAIKKLQSNIDLFDVIDGSPLPNWIKN